jgi:hypothetical protein
VLKDPHGRTILVKEGFRIYEDVSLPYLITWVQTLIDKFLRNHSQQGKEEYLVQSVEITFPQPETNFQQSKTYDFLQNKREFGQSARCPSSRIKKLFYPHLKGELAHPGAHDHNAAYVRWVLGGSMEQYWMVLRNKVQFAGSKSENEISILTVHTTRRRGTWHRGIRLKKSIGAGHEFIMGDEVFGTYEFFVQQGISEQLNKILDGDEAINSFPEIPQEETRDLAPTSYANVVDNDASLGETLNPLPSTEELYPETLAPPPSRAEVLHQTEVPAVSCFGKLDDEELTPETLEPISSTGEVLYLEEPGAQSSPANSALAYSNSSTQYRTYVSMNEAWESVSNKGAMRLPSDVQSPTANDKSAHSTGFAQCNTHSPMGKADETADELQSSSTCRTQLRTRRARGNLRREALSPSLPPSCEEDFPRQEAHFASLSPYDIEDSPPQETVQLDSHTEEFPRPIKTPDNTDENATIGTAYMAKGRKKAILIDLKRKWKTNDPEFSADIARDLVVRPFSETTDDDEPFQSQEELYEPRKKEDVSKAHTIVKNIAALSLNEADNSESFQSHEGRFRPNKNEGICEVGRRTEVNPVSSWEEVRSAGKRGVSASKRKGRSKTKLQKSRNRKKRKCGDSIPEKLCYKFLTTHSCELFGFPRP